LIKYQKSPEGRESGRAEEGRGWVETAKAAVSALVHQIPAGRVSEADPKLGDPLAAALRKVNKLRRGWDLRFWRR
jgi:hypothetical protein